jgi:pimeloyl-ACP methyl ester carboxylesterase
VVLGVLLGGQAAVADEPPAENGSPKITIERDPDSLVTKAIIEATDGQIAWADFMAALARAKGYDDDALADVPRRKAVDLRRRSTRLVLAMMNALLEPGGLQFAILPPEAAGEPKLQVTLNRRAMLASQRRLEKMLRLAAVDRLADLKSERKYGLTWVDEPPAANQEAVVVVHGLGSSPEYHASLTADLRRAGLRVGNFAYPGDEALDDSAKSLSSELKRFRNQHPGVRLRLVTLSMGGLVARRAVEDLALDPGNVVQLVMVAPPNHGSALAYCAFGLQIWQFLDDPKARTVAQRFYDTVEDGLCDASEDLRPDSEFLKRLKSLARNPRVRYSLLLGTGAPLSQHAVDGLREHVEQAKERYRFVQLLGPKLDRVLADGDELIYGKGDGVVAVKRGRLEGVDDVLLLDFNHLSIGQPPQTDGEEQLRAEIVKRVKGP